MRNLIAAALLLFAAAAFAASDCKQISYCDANQWPPSCLTGDKQSPIDISRWSGIVGGQLPIYSGTFKPMILNTEHSIQITNPVGSITIGNDTYPLLEFHFHIPAEHTFSGVAAPMEMHLVYGTVASDGTKSPVAAVAVLFDDAADRNTTLDAIVDALPIDPCKDKAGAQLNLSQLVPTDLTRYFMYDGSLTTPVCTQELKWFILKARSRASKTQRKAIMGNIGPNARQARNPGRRPVTYVAPRKKK
jgi:carbonic anhydrase